MTLPRDPNLDALVRVARKLGRAVEDVVFVGGSTTGLLLTDSAASPVRPTKDVDVIVEVASRAQYGQLVERLKGYGFREDVSEGAPLCRFLHEADVLDVMPTDPEVLGFTNRWYGPAIRESVWRQLPAGPMIRLVTAPYFVATKLEAYRGRGGGNPISSHDLEDVLSVVDGRPELAGEAAVTAVEMKEYLKEQLGDLLSQDAFLDAVSGFVPSGAAGVGREAIVLERLRALSRL